MKLPGAVNRLSFRLLSAGLALVLISSNSFADKVNRRGDKAVNGDVSAVAKDKVTVKALTGGNVDVPANEIISIEWANEPAELGLGRGADERGDLTRALDMYGKSGSAAKPEVKADVEFLIARTTARIALSGDAAKLDDAAKKLDAFVKGNSASYRYFPALMMFGQVLLAKEDYDGAEKAFTSLSQAPWAEYKMAAATSNARLALRKGNLDAALAAYEQVIAQNATAPAEVSRRNEALLGKGNVLLQQSKADAALQVITEAISKTDPEDTSVMAEAFILKGECLKALGKSQEAILAYLHVPVLFEKEKQYHAQALYNLALLWPKVDQQDRGLAARQELQETYPESPWTKKLP